jgi:hypothetical protein
MSEERFAEILNELQSRGDRAKLMQLSSVIEVRTILDERPLSRAMSLEEWNGRARDFNRRWQAHRHGYSPPPPEKHCPPKPADGLCECCSAYTRRLCLDHCHDTGAFRGWVCNSCNSGAGIMDNVERLKKRIAFLERSVA